MNWYTLEAHSMLKQAEIERTAKEHWKFVSILSPKQLKANKKSTENLYGKAVHVLQEMLDSDNAELRLQAAEIVIKHSVKQRSKMTLSS